MIFKERSRNETDNKKQKASKVSGGNEGHVMGNFGFLPYKGRGEEGSNVLPFTKKTSANPFLLSTEKENSWLLVGNAPVKKKTLRFTPSQCTFGIRHLGNRTKFGSGYGKRSFLKGLIYFGTTKVSPLCIL